MHYYELVVTTFLNENIHFSVANEVISDHINRTMLEDAYLKNKHLSQGYKFYNFSQFYPLEKNKIYQSNKIYIFRIRSLEKEFIEKISKQIKRVITKFRVIATEIIEKKKGFITNLYTVTPTIVTLAPRKHWCVGDDFEKLKIQLHSNIEKKYNAFYKANVKTETFFSGIEILNPKTLVIPYKESYLIGNKFRLYIKEDVISQKLAFTVLGCGLGEKNSIGMGYCHAHY